MAGLHHKLWGVQTVRTLISASDVPFYRPKRSLPYSTLLCITFNVSGDSRPSFVTKAKWISIIVNYSYSALRQRRISQDNVTQLINFKQRNSYTPPSQNPNVQNDAKPWLRAYCMVLEIVFRVNFSYCGNKNGFSFDDARLPLNSRLWQSNFKRFKLSILLSFRDLSFIKSLMGKGGSLFDAFSLWPHKDIKLFSITTKFDLPPINKVFESNSIILSYQCTTHRIQTQTLYISFPII